MRNTKYDYSSIHIEVPRPLSEEIITWGREEVSDDDIFVSQDDFSYGREDEIHITLLYGLHSADPSQAEEILKGTKPFRIDLGRMKLFTHRPNYNVLVIKVYSHDLVSLHTTLGKLEHTDRYLDFNPHVTIAFLKKNRRWKIKASPWRNRGFFVEEATFSSKDGFKKRIAF